MKKVLVLILVSVQLYAFGQEGAKVSADSLFDSYVYEYNDRLNVKLSLSNDTEKFRVNASPQSYQIAPNTTLKTKLTIAYRFLAFSIGFGPKILPGNDDEERKGESEIFVLNLNVFTKRWIQNLKYQKIEGYYLENTVDFVPGWDQDKDPYVLFPNLEYEGFSGFTGYKFNKNFSFRALATQTSRQRKSTGSFVPMLFYRYYIVDDKTPLTGQNTTQKSNNFETHITAAYFYTHVFNERFYTSYGGLIGGGFVHTELLTRFNDGDVLSYSVNPSFVLEGDLALGYNVSNFYTGVQVKASFQRYSQGDGVVLTDDKVVTFQVFVGVRFKALKKVNAWLDEKGFN